MKLTEALLTVHDPEWLMDFARTSGLKELETPEKTAEAISETLLDPEIMKERMITLHDEDIAFISYCLKQDQPFLPSTAYYASADRLRDLQYGFAIDQKMNFVMPEDVKEVYRSIDTPGFHERRKRMSWLNDCIDLIPYLYAILSVGDLGTLYRKHRGFEESNEEIVMTMLRPLSKRPEFPCILEGNELITKGLKESGQEERLREIHETIPVSFPSYSEIKDLIENGYPGREKSWQNLKRFLIHDLRVSDDFTDALLNGIWQYIATGNAFSDTLKMIRNESIPVRKDQEPALKNVMSDAWNHTRMIMCNGGAPYTAMPYCTYIFTDN